MFRKTILAIAATASLGAAALAPLPALARDHDWHHRSHHRWHGSGLSVRFFAPGPYAYARCHLVRRWVHTRTGWHLRRIEVCR